MCSLKKTRLRPTKSGNRASFCSSPDLSWTSRAGKQRRNHQAVRPFGRGGELPPVGLDHRLCNGQPYAISPLAGVSRGIPPVKPVKHILQQFLAQHFRRVLHRQAQVFALSGQTQGDLPALRRIFQRVVQKDGHQLHQAFLLAH